MKNANFQNATSYEFIEPYSSYDIMHSGLTHLDYQYIEDNKELQEIYISRVYFHGHRKNPPKELKDSLFYFPLVNAIKGKEALKIFSLEDISVHSVPEDQSHFPRSSDVGADELLKVLKHLEVEKITLKHCRIGLRLSDGEKDPLAELIEDNKNLTLLDVSHSYEWDIDKNQFIESLNKNSNLKVLRLAGCKFVDDEVAESLAKKLKEGILEEIDLSCNEQITDKGAIALANALKGKNIIDPASYKFSNDITKALEEAPQITKTILDELEGNKSLKVLNLAGCKISDEVVIALAESLKTNQTLEVLNLAGCKISDEGAKALASALKENENLALKVLNLSNNDIGDDGFKAITEALRNNETLQELDLSGNKKRSKKVEILQGLGDIIRETKLKSFYLDPITEIKEMKYKDEERTWLGWASSFPPFSYLFASKKTLEEEICLELLKGLKENSTLTHFSPHDKPILGTAVTFMGETELLGGKRAIFDSDENNDDLTDIEYYGLSIVGFNTQRRFFLERNKKNPPQSNFKPVAHEKVVPKKEATLAN